MAVRKYALHEKVTHALAQQIIAKINNGSLFGDKIDTSNPEEMLVAAYLAGQAEERETSLEDLAILARRK